MENEFNKPKVLIDLEEYELLKDIQKSFNHTDGFNEDILDFIYAIRDNFGISVQNKHMNRVDFIFYSSTKEYCENLSNPNILEYIKQYIKTSLLIEMKKENQNNDTSQK
jgi:hypothetical protein